jgi:hypothetical protein
MNNTNITHDSKDMSYNISKAPTLFKDWIEVTYHDERNDPERYRAIKNLVVRNVFFFFKLSFTGFNPVFH